MLPERRSSEIARVPGDVEKWKRHSSAVRLLPPFRPTKPFQRPDAVVLKPLLGTNDLEHSAVAMPNRGSHMELQQRVDSHDNSTARLLADLDSLSWSNSKRVSEVETERPEILRKFLERFFADRSGSIV